MSKIRNQFLIKVLSLFLGLILVACSNSFAAANVAVETPKNTTAAPDRAPSAIPVPGEFYSIGSPTLTDIYVSPTGSDQNNGLSRTTPLQTIGAAWGKIPAGELISTGYRINLLPGTYPCEGDCINYFSEKKGSYAFPIIIQAADGPGSVTLLGGLNIAKVSYVYLLNLTLKAGREAGAAFGNNVLHIEQGDHLLLRGLTLQGPQKCLTDTCNDMQEVLKVNQSNYVFLEQSDLSGTYQTALDYFAVQHGHLLQNHIHHSGGRCAYLKGGSSYFWVEGNEFNNCVEAGFQAGEGSNLAFMQTPWLHYEAYDIKVVNNLIHDIHGAGLSVSGGFNILMAFNTLYKVGLEDEGGRPWALIQLIHGSRSCIAADEFGGEKGTQTQCQAQLNLGAWGTASVGEENGGEWIPNRNIYIMNNLFYNPIGSTTRYVQFVVNGPVIPPARAHNLPNPSQSDENLVIRGNVIWNKPMEGSDLIGDNNGSGNLGCMAKNPTCNEAQLTKENTINSFEPQLRDPAHGDFRLVSGSNLLSIPSVSLPDFNWMDAPTKPGVVAGNLGNQVLRDYDRLPRLPNSPVGAYTKS